MTFQASRMETHSLPGYIHCTSVVYKTLKHRYLIQTALVAECNHISLVFYERGPYQTIEFALVSCDIVCTMSYYSLIPISEPVITLQPHQQASCHVQACRTAAHQNPPVPPRPSAMLYIHVAPGIAWDPEFSGTVLQNWNACKLLGLLSLRVLALERGKCRYLPWTFKEFIL